VTRGSISGQVKAISMIVAIEGLIPDRRAGSKNNQSAPPPSQPDIYPAAWLRRQQGETIDPQPGPALLEQEDEPNLAEPEPAPGSPEDAPSAPDTRVPFSIKRTPLPGAAELTHSQRSKTAKKIESYRIL
jgi:hypothetical protein